MEIQNFERNPLLQQLIKNYITIQYEENADYSQSAMLAELRSLTENNQLIQLFQCEYVSNYGLTQE